MDTKFSKLKKHHHKDICSRKKDYGNLKKEISNARKVTEIGIRSREILCDIEEEFKKVTKLNSLDISILFIATGLQIARQQFQKNYFIDDSRLTDKEASGGTNYDRSQRGKGYYNTSVEEILSNPVPFDTQNGAAIKGVNLGGGSGHRIATLGHDPILGLIFGTANISTRTVTLSTPLLTSYHVKYGEFLTKEGSLSKRKNDYFAEQADIFKIMKYGLADKILFKEGTEGFQIFLISLWKEILHLRSDLLSTESLQIPFVSLNTSVAKKLSDYNIDMASLYTVGKQATGSLLINHIIKYFHQLIILQTNPDIDLKFLEVRTRKILSYSNVLASTSNVLEVAIRLVIGQDTTSLNKLDIGGLGVTIFRVISDVRYQIKIKEEFLINRWYEILDEIK